MNKMVKNILLAIVAGIVAGMLLGGLFAILDLNSPIFISTIGVGVVITITYVWLNNRKE